MTVTIRHGLPDALREGAARMYWRAFGPKLGRVLGPEPRAMRFLMRVMSRDRCIVALDAGGALLGLAGFRTGEGSFAGGTVRDLYAIYGPLGGLWRGFVLQLLADEPDTGRFLLDGLCVADHARGQGVGTRLLAAICDEAQRQGYPAVRLDVVDTNPRARALYERAGFVTQDVARLGLLRFVFGFNAAHRMIRAL